MKGSSAPGKVCILDQIDAVISAAISEKLAFRPPFLLPYRSGKISIQDLERAKSLPSEHDYKRLMEAAETLKVAFIFQDEFRAFLSLDVHQRNPFLELAAQAMGCTIQHIQRASPAALLRVPLCQQVQAVELAAVQRFRGNGSRRLPVRHPAKEYDVLPLSAACRTLEMMSLFCGEFRAIVRLPPEGRKAALEMAAAHIKAVDGSP